MTGSACAEVAVYRERRRTATVGRHSSDQERTTRPTRNRDDDHDAFHRSASTAVDEATAECASCMVVRRSRIADDDVEHWDDEDPAKSRRHSADTAVPSARRDSAPARCDDNAAREQKRKRGHDSSVI